MVFFNVFVCLYLTILVFLCVCYEGFGPPAPPYVLLLFCVLQDYYKY